MKYSFIAVYHHKYKPVSMYFIRIYFFTFIWPMATNINDKRFEERFTNQEINDQIMPPISEIHSKSFTSKIIEIIKDNLDASSLNTVYLGIIVLAIFVLRRHFYRKPNQNRTKNRNGKTIVI